MKTSVFLNTNLKVVSVIFLSICFLCLKDSTCETRKNVFYFISKAVFVLDKIKFQLFRYSNVMMPSNGQAWNTKHILLNNLESEHSLVMKFGQFMWYYKMKIFIKKFCEKYELEISSRPFLVFKDSSVEGNLRRSSCWFGRVSIALLLHI